MDLAGMNRTRGSGVAGTECGNGGSDGTGGTQVTPMLGGWNEDSDIDSER